MAEPYRQPASRLSPDAAGSVGASRAEAADLAALMAAPERFGLFAALRLIEAAHPDRPRMGRARRAQDEPVRLGQPPHMHFPPAEIAGFAGGQAGRAPRLLTYAFGLFGPQGPLPLHVSREALTRARQNADPVLADFCDVFHHRMLALYWRAHAGARPAVEQDRPAENRFAQRLRAVAGMAGPGFRGRSALPERFMLFAAGLLAMQTRPPEALARLITLYFAVPVRVQEFVGAWLCIPAHAHTRLVRGESAPRLGQGSVVGTRVWARHHRFRIVLGPLGLCDFLRFLPDGDSRAKLDAMVARVPGPELDWDVQLVLRHEEVPVLRLDGTARLNWTSWIAARRPRAQDSDEVVLPGSASGHTEADERR
ncbi:type VI secretion system baseplate subunit TssG [Falsiroseomonas sp.]|uniref:type VI secretion system baseplate subunit TssG n=1 Tax=Falsiroseomonas sp. TaxID=2870721 RepID=UPI003567EB03